MVKSDDSSVCKEENTKNINLRILVSADDWKVCSERNSSRSYISYNNNPTNYIYDNALIEKTPYQTSFNTNFAEDEMAEPSAVHEQFSNSLSVVLPNFASEPWMEMCFHESWHP